MCIGKVIPMAGGRGAFHSEVIFENLSVPAENLLGKEGEGFAIAMQCLDAGRINWAAYCVGAAQQLVDAMGGYEARAAGDENEVFTHDFKCTR